jgi:hypothetical protein
MSAVNIGSLGNAQAIGWADAQITRLGAGQLAFSPTWNDAGTTFAGFRMNVTDTASNAASLLMDLQVGGANRFSVSKSSVMTLGGLTINPNNGALTLLQTFALDMQTSNAMILRHGNSDSLFIRPVSSGVGRIICSNSTNTPQWILTADNANEMAVRNGTNAQAFRVYGTFTDASNHRRLVATMSTSGVAEIKPEGAGTGASGNVLHISGLPTSNPGPGILWNNAGTPAIGT